MVVINLPSLGARIGIVRTPHTKLSNTAFPSWTTAHEGISLWHWGLPSLPVASILSAKRKLRKAPWKHQSLQNPWLVVSTPPKYIHRGWYEPKLKHICKNKWNHQSNYVKAAGQLNCPHCPSTSAKLHFTKLYPKNLKCASAKHLLEEGIERVSPVRLAFLQTLMAWLCCCKGPKHQNHNSTCASLMALVSRSSGLPVALSAPRHGDFPRSISGSKLPVCSLRGHAFPALWKLSGEIWWNATSKKQSVQLQRHCEDNVRTILPPMTNLAIMRAATSAPCFSSCVLHCLLVCLAYRRIKKNLFETCLCQTPVGEGIERVSPVRLAFLQTLMAWLCCCKGPKHQNHNSTCASLMALVSRSSGLPVALSAPRHGDFPAAYLGASSLCVHCVAMLFLPSENSQVKYGEMQPPRNNLYKAPTSLRGKCQHHSFHPWPI